MRFLVDENVPKQIVKLLRSLVGENNVVYVTEKLSLRSLPNSQLVEYAKSINAIIVTSDSDFLRIVTDVKVLYIRHEVARSVALREIPQERFLEMIRQALELLSRQDVKIVKIVDINTIEPS